uniref:Uncharacterized protein n=1 Tax=Ananas comosus var. bracteatus TaxID=296719 RepID=A0A6V7PXY3_ANACO|nr:unnamed protein product [Ananas comosus var. bracteatus]
MVEALDQVASPELMRPHHVARKFQARPQHEGVDAVVKRSIGRFELKYFDPFLTHFYACLPLCSFAHAYEVRSPQAGTQEIAIATHARPCGIGRRNGMPWGRLIPRVGMLTTTGPLGKAQAGLPTGRSYTIGILVTQHAKWILTRIVNNDTLLITL